MAYCVPLGIPYSVFMGRAQRAGEPTWSEEDSALALEWQDWQALICPGCGHHLEESTDEANVYDVTDRVCFGCEAKESAVKSLQENDRAVTAGRKIGVVLAGRDGD